jgi:hypothetical protein
MEGVLDIVEFRDGVQPTFQTFPQNLPKKLSRHHRLVSSHQVDVHTFVSPEPQCCKITRKMMTKAREDAASDAIGWTAREQQQSTVTLGAGRMMPASS